MSKVNDLLAELDDAFEVAEAKAAILAGLQSAAATAIATGQSTFDALKSHHAAIVERGAMDQVQARKTLEALRQEVNTRIAALTGGAVDPRVSVK